MKRQTYSRIVSNPSEETLILDLLKESELLGACKAAIAYANGRESEWGQRAEHCFEILESAITSANSSGE